MSTNYVETQGYPGPEAKVPGRSRVGVTGRSRVASSFGTNGRHSSGCIDGQPAKLECLSPRVTSDPGLGARLVGGEGEDREEREAGGGGFSRSGIMPQVWWK